MLIAIVSFVQILAGPLHKPLAYLDPGSGSFILQILLASLLAGMLFFKNFWRGLFGKFRKPSPPDETDENEPKEE